MIQEVTPDDVQKSLLNNDEVILLDVRTKEEFDRNRIKKAINVPVDEVVEKIEQLITDKTKKIYVYCLSGARSEAAVETMTQMGYKNVFSVSGGLLVWRIKRFPVEN